MRSTSKIIKIFTRKLFPFILLFGCYLISHGHISPGGGFQGGVIFGSAIILLGLVEGVKITQKRFREDILSLVKNLGMLFFVLMGLFAIMLGYYFLADFFPHGKGGIVPRAGFIFFLNLVAGFMVGCGIAVIFYRLVKHIMPHKLRKKPKLWV